VRIELRRAKKRTEDPAQSILKVVLPLEAGWFPPPRLADRNFGALSTVQVIHKTRGDIMRSELVFEAVHTLRNRYTLCQLASKATRKFHRPSTRIQDTTNEVLNRIAGAEREEVILEPETATEAQRRAA
jgi:hypothetical protein